MRAVNLLPRDLERDSSAGGRAPYLVAGAGVAAVTAAAAVLFMSASGSVSEQSSQLDSVESAIAALPTRGQPVVAPSAIAQERADRVAALAAAMSTRVPVDRLLRDLGYVLPEDAWLTGLTTSAPIASPAGATPGSPRDQAGSTPEVTIQGATYSHASVARVLSRLAALPVLTNVRLAASARIEPTSDAGSADAGKQKRAQKQKPVVTFTITAGVTPGGGA